jgi:hypothetical protein
MCPKILMMNLSKRGGSDTKLAEPAETNQVDNFVTNHGCHNTNDMRESREKQQNWVKRSKDKGRGLMGGKFESTQVFICYKCYATLLWKSNGTDFEI